MIWFAKKQGGEIITLTEKEALTHFRQNNISQRMKLEFLGTSDGLSYKQKRAGAMARLDETLPIDEYKKLAQEVNDDIEKAFNDELEIAKKNGVQQPRQDLDFIVVENGGEIATGERRKDILRRM